MSNSEPPIQKWWSNTLDSIQSIPLFEQDKGISHAPVWILVVVLAMGVALATVPQLWRFFKYAITIVHEIGHAIAALLSGRRLSGIKINGDMSGATTSRGKPRGLGMIWTTWWGYPFPSVVAWVLIWAVVGGWSKMALVAMIIVMAFVLLLSRSFNTLLVVLTAGAILVTTALYASGPIRVTVVYMVAILLAVGSFRGIANVVHAHLPGPNRDVSSSDAYMLFRLTIIPSPVWIMTWICIGIVVAFSIISMILPNLP